MMRQLGGEPLAPDFHMFLLEGPRRGTRAHLLDVGFCHLWVSKQSKCIAS